MKTRSQSTYESKFSRCYAFAKPMASKKMLAKCLKFLKKAREYKKSSIIKGTEKIRKFILNGKMGIVLFAGDRRPKFDLRGQLREICEQYSIAYIYVPSAEDLGEALGRFRNCEAVLIKYRSKYVVRYTKIHWSLLKRLRQANSDINNNALN